MSGYHDRLQETARLVRIRRIRKAIFAGVFGLSIALLLAVSPSLATTLFSDPLQVVSLQPYGSEVVTFTSPDALGLSFVTYAMVGVTNGAASVEVRRDNVSASANQTLTTGQR